MKHQRDGSASPSRPKQEQGECLDCRSDIFSLGAALHLMLTGTHSAKKPEADKRPYADMRISQRYGSLLALMLSLEKERRPQSWRELVDRCPPSQVHGVRV